MKITLKQEILGMPVGTECTVLNDKYFTMTENKYLTVIDGYIAINIKYALSKPEIFKIEVGKWLNILYMMNEQF